MSGDETFVLFTAGAAALLATFVWYIRIGRTAGFGYPNLLRLALGIAPPLAIAAVFAVIKAAGSFDVRNAPDYLLFYTVLGTAWMFGAVKLMDYSGISFRDDAIERRNPAAVIVIVAVLFSHAAIYAGANIGDGPGWWCVLAAAFIGSASWFVLWSVLEWLCSASERITVERDTAAAVRISGFMLASAYMCARGSAGDWTSLEQTLAEFVVAWPAVPLAAIAIGIEWYFQSVPRQKRMGAIGSVLVAALYFAVATIAVETSGPLPNNPIYDRVAGQSP